MNGLIRAFALAVVAVALAACAGRPKPLDPARPVTVTEVRVSAQRIEDFGFAESLQAKLENSLGRATAQIGQSSVLEIRVLDRSRDSGPLAFIGGSSQTANLELWLVDSDTGQVVRSRKLRASAANRKDADAMLMAMLTENIRALLGLSGYPPHPIAGLKRDVAVPLLRPEGADAELLSADPLLNGTVTPTTMDFDPVPEKPLVLDISRPLLDASEAKSGSMGKPPTEPSQAVDVLQGMELRTSPTTTTMEPESDPRATGEPCIITLDNDCSDPDKG